MRFWVLRFEISGFKVFDFWARGDGVGVHSSSCQIRRA